MQMIPVEAVRFRAIIDEAIDKLEVLSVMAPEITAHKDELSQMVNDEISRIIEEQRNLQNRYEELILQRSQLKNVSNKAKYKEIQNEIEQTATRLRFATKILCRNLKENPNVAENILKIQKEREELQKLLIQISTDLKDGSMKTLTETLEKERRKNEEIKNTIASVKQTTVEIQKIEDEIAEQIEERRRDEVSQNQAIDKLREDLQELRAKTVLEAKYNKKEAKAHLETTRRVHQQMDRDKEIEIAKVSKTSEVEKQVHDEAAAFLERKHEELQRLTEFWDSKHETDIEEQDRLLEGLKSKRANDLVRLTELRAKYKEVQEMVHKEKRLIEARSDAREMQRERNEAAIKIQTTWRAYSKRKAAKEKLRKLKKAAAKNSKGTAGGKRNGTSSQQRKRSTSRSKSPNKRTSTANQKSSAK
jgi:hypothetical protein